MFYHAKDIDMLTFGCTLPNLTNIFLHKSTKDKFFPFTENDKDYHTYIKSWLTGVHRSFLIGKQKQARHVLETVTMLVKQL